MGRIAVEVGCIGAEIEQNPIEFEMFRQSRGCPDPAAEAAKNPGPTNKVI
jgi:hypothetical protein